MRNFLIAKIGVFVLAAGFVNAGSNSETINTQTPNPVEETIVQVAETDGGLEISGDPVLGEKVFRKCRACHKIEEGKNSAGPSLYGVFGRPAADVEGFRYSKAMRESGWVWDVPTLTAFLANPRKSLPRTKMAFAGLKKPKEIEDIIAYLATLDD